MRRKKFLLASIILVISFSVFLFAVQNKKLSFPSKITYTCPQNETVFSAISKTGHTVTAQDFSFGKMIISLDNTSQGNGKYWLYSVNNQEATISADNYHCQGSEKISWMLK